ncbi:MAG: hypothetical protein JXB15_10240 [Anaerolineales bacterium]|nr:hypothetical protein [Anaerolineales bacterium]
MSRYRSCLHRIAILLVFVALIAASSCSLFPTDKTEPTIEVSGPALTHAAATIEAEVSATSAAAPPPSLSAPSPTGQPTQAEAPQPTTAPAATATNNITAPTAAAPTAAAPTNTTAPTNTLRPTEPAVLWPFTPVPTFTLIPSPTQVLKAGTWFKVEYLNIHGCDVPWAIFSINNQGTNPLESLYLSIQDLTTGLMVFNPAISDLPFLASDHVCEFPGISRIEPGQRLYVGGPLSGARLRGHSMRATIKLCSQDGLAGICSQMEYDFVMP